MLAQDDESRRQLGLAAAQGDSEAQFRLGAWHLAQDDFAEARRLFGLASAQGHASAQSMLGQGPRSEAEASQLVAAVQTAIEALES